MKVAETSCRPNHTVPYGTVPFLYTFLAINCQASIIYSLRDKIQTEPRRQNPFLIPVHEIGATSRPRFEDEDDDEYENDFSSAHDHLSLLTNHVSLLTL